MKILATLKQYKTALIYNLLLRLLLVCEIPGSLIAIMKFFYHLSLSVAAALMSANSVVGATAEYSSRAAFDAAVGTLTGSESFTDSWADASSVSFASGFTASCEPDGVVNRWDYGSDGDDTYSLRIDRGNLRLKL